MIPVMRPFRMAAQARLKEHKPPVGKVLFHIMRRLVCRFLAIYLFHNPRGNLCKLLEDATHHSSFSSQLIINHSWLDLLQLDNICSC